jgi:hypothetical protein
MLFNILELFALFLKRGGEASAELRVEQATDRQTGGAASRSSRAVAFATIRRRWPLAD